MMPSLCAPLDQLRVVQVEDWPLNRFGVIFGGGRLTAEQIAAPVRSSGAGEAACPKGCVPGQALVVVPLTRQRNSLSP
ncbi:predicted protein [Streptomyces sp. C]|nr:predicted protein [Streptomyces sp. C]